MIKYEIRENNTIIQFSTIEEATNYNSNAQIFEVEVNEIIPIITTEEKLLKDIDFGRTLIKTFLKENRDIPRAFTMEDNIMLLNKFSAIETLSRLGDIKTILILIQAVEIDEIFTQERKDNFILMINNYLNS